jgi:hypothetical protein
MVNEIQDAARSGRALCSKSSLRCGLYATIPHAYRKASASLATTIFTNEVWVYFFEKFRKDAIIIGAIPPIIAAMEAPE